MPTLEDLTGPDLHATLHDLRSRGSIVWVDAIEGWLVLGRQAAIDVMRDPTTFTVDDPRFTTGQVVGPSMLSLDGDEHRRHRAPFVAPYKRGALSALETWIEGEAERLVTELAATGSAELRTQYAGPLATLAIHRSLGLVDTDPADLLAWYRAIVAAVSELSAGRAAPPEAEAAMAGLRAAVADTVAADRGSMLGRVATQLAPDEVAQNAAIVLFGAIETAEGMITNAVWHLLTTTGLQERIRADRSWVPALVEESLRMEPAASVVDRYATVDVALHGASIGAGDLVRVSLAGANRDPHVFADPDVFDITRPDARRHLAFATGPHLCIGLMLARIETVTAVEALLAAGTGLELDRTASTPPTGLIFRKPETLTVGFG